MGDIFDDNDEVFCEIGSEQFSEVVKKEGKHDKFAKGSKNLPTEKKT